MFRVHISTVLEFNTILGQIIACRSEKPKVYRSIRIVFFKFHWDDELPNHEEPIIVISSPDCTPVKKKPSMSGKEVNDEDKSSGTSSSYE